MIVIIMNTAMDLPPDREDPIVRQHVFAHQVVNALAQHLDDHQRLLTLLTAEAAVDPIYCADVVLATETCATLESVVTDTTKLPEVVDRLAMLTRAARQWAVEWQTHRETHRQPTMADLNFSTDVSAFEGHLLDKQAACIDRIERLHGQHASIAPVDSDVAGADLFVLHHTEIALAKAVAKWVRTPAGCVRRDQLDDAVSEITQVRAKGPAEATVRGDRKRPLPPDSVDQGPSGTRPG